MIYFPVAVNIEHSEDLTEIVFRTSEVHRVKGDSKLPEIDQAVLIGVVNPPNVLAYLLRCRCRKALGQHGVERFRGDQAVWMIRKENFVVGKYHTSVFICVLHEEIYVFF